MPKRMTQEEFEEQVFLKLGTDYKVLGQYINRNTKIKMLHYVCGNEFEKNPHDVVSKSSGCPYCNGNKNAKYNEQWVKENTPFPYEYRSGYTLMSKKCVFYCSKCDTEFLQMPSRLLIQHIYGCNCCSTKKRTQEEFLQELGQKCLNEYEVLDNYVNIATKIQFKHKPCGTIFKTTPEYFISRSNKQYCPICYYNKSKNEIIINKFLRSNNIDFQTEFSFPDLPKRRFDFYLPKLNTCIEYDGEQHYFPIKFFGGINSLNEAKKRDEEKNEFCLKNGIKLFRIPYYEKENIPQILHKIFKEKSSTTIEKYLITE